MLQVLEKVPEALPSVDLELPAEVLTEAIQPFISQLSVILGGLFGLYLLFFLARLYYDHRQMKLLRDIRFDLDQLNQHYGLSTSKQRKGWLLRAFGELKRK